MDVADIRISDVTTPRSSDQGVKRSSMEQSRQLTHQQRISAALLKLRTAARLTSRALAQRVGISQSKVSRIESGKVLPTVDEVTAWAQATGADQETLSQLLDQLDTALTEFATWQVALREGHEGLVRGQEKAHEREVMAAVAHYFQSAIVPGLLQTAEYARRVLQLHDAIGGQDYAAAVARRLDRQQVLYDETHQFEFLVTEQALRARVGPTSVLIPQLDRIGQLSTLSNVTIGVIPSTVPITTLVMHAFALFEPAAEEQSPFVIVELVHGEVTVRDPRGVGLYQDRLARLRESAIYGDEVRALLALISREHRESGAR
jgi:transcriptional regulator with XRE-family HTH domain